MKILVLTDIHGDERIAQSHVKIEKPDFVLDCGDHEYIRNLFGTIPHFYIRGNHEPDKIIYEANENYPMPNLIFTGQVITVKKGNDRLSFSGMGGNFSTRGGNGSIDTSTIDLLSKIPSQSIDVLLFHQSPLDVDPNIAEKSGALNVIKEIDRIEPGCLFAGHVGTYQKQKIGKGIRLFRLPDVRRGYGIIEVKNNEFNFVYRKTHHYGN